MADQSAAAPLGSIRFWNWRTAALWLGMALIGLVTFGLRRQGLLGLAGLATSAYCLQAAIVSLLGVNLRRDSVSVPRSMSLAFPILVLGRRRLNASWLNEVTFLGKFLGAERVTLDAPDERFPVLFSSRKQRLAFFAAFRSRRPDIKIYRGY